MSNEHYMQHAIATALEDPRRPFGAVLVDRGGGDIIARGHNRGAHNPTWHGEIDAINAATAAGIDDWSRLKLYTTAEPCCMCQGAILWAGIAEVIYGTSIRSLTCWGWPQIDVPAEEIVRRTPFRDCAVTGGVLEAECDALFADAMNMPPAVGLNRPLPGRSDA